MVDAFDQVGQPLERAGPLDQPVGHCRLGAQFRADPFAQEGLGLGPHVDVGVEIGRDAFLHHHRLLQQQQVRLDRHVEVAGDGEQPFEHPPDADVLDRQAPDRLSDGPQRGRELLGIVVRRHILRLEVNFRDARVIGGDQAVEDFGQPAPGARVDPSHDPEVDRRQPPVGKHEQIALVEVGMEEAVDHGLAQEGADEDSGERLRIVAGGDQVGAPGQLDPVDPLERQHPARGPLPVDLGDVEAALRDHILLQLAGAGALALKVELAPGPLAEMGDDGLGAKPFRLVPGMGLEVGGGPFIGFQRGGEGLLDAGAEDLDGDVPTIGGHRAVDLRDRGGADRHFVDRGEQAFDRAFERLLDRLADLREGSGREIVLQPHEVDRGLVADQVGAGGEGLAELDRSRAELAQRGGIIGLGRLMQAQARKAHDPAREGRGQGIALDPLQGAVTGERAAPAQDAEKVGDGGGHGKWRLIMPSTPTRCRRGRPSMSRCGCG